LIKMIILEENFKWHLEAFASELFIYSILRNSQHEGCSKSWGVFFSLQDIFWMNSKVVLYVFFTMEAIPSCTGKIYPIEQTSKRNVESILGF